MNKRKYGSFAASLGLINQPKENFGSLRLGGANTPPINTVAPVISGTAVVGQTLSCTNGTWTGTPIITYTYQWMRNGVNIGGATNSTYTLVQVDAGNTSNIKCVVTASNGAGSASADSNVITVIYDATADAYITASGITDNTQKLAANFEMYTIKAGGITKGYAALYPIIGGTNTRHSFNMFNSATKQLTYAGTITHNANGMQGNAVNGVATSGINPSVDLNGDFACWFYSRTSTTSGTWGDLGVIAGGANPGILMSVKTNAANAFAANCDLNTSLAALLNSSGFFFMKRVGNTVTIKRNDVTIHTFTAPNTSYQNGNMSLMAVFIIGSINQNYSGKQYTDFGFVKDTFTSDMDTAAYNAVLGKETILGRNV